MTGTSSARIDHAVAPGTFRLNGGTFDVDNNVWVVGDDTECVVIDVPHSVEDLFDLVDGSEVFVGSAAVQVIHTPGHAPGAWSFYFPDLGCVFTGDTLFEGGPGATGRSYSDRSLLEESIAERLFVASCGHRRPHRPRVNTTIGQEAARAHF